MKPQFNRRRHGSLHDRGSADAYYRRKRDPHWYPNGSYKDPKITDLTDEEISEYNQGYDDQVESGEFKY